MKKQRLTLYIAALGALFLLGHPTHALENTGFEIPDQGNSWSYTPTGGMWTFQSSAGLSGPVGPWIADNVSPDPLGDQFAFLQRATSIQQSLTGLSVGLHYNISFFESYRVGQAPSNDVSVVLNPGQGDEQVIYNNPGITNRTWEARQTDSFIATNATYTLMFRATGPSGTDQTSLIDGVNVNFVDLPGPPTVTNLDPADDASEVLVFSDLEVTFNEPVTADSGTITISNVTDSSSTVIPVGDAQLSIVANLLTINPTADLLPTKDYAVWIEPGALVDLNTNAFAGITNATDWTFSTAAIDLTNPTAASLSPTNGAVEVSRLPALAITFDEVVQKGSGDIVVKQLSDDAIIETIPVTSGSVTLSGAIATIQTSTLLTLGTNYYVEVTSGAFQDLSSNPFAGISGNSSWAFTVTTIRFEPITSDADSGISDVKVYTHAIDFGNNAAWPVATVNGVVFANGGPGAFPATNGTSQTVGTGSSNLPTSNGGNGNANAFLTDPGMRNLVGDMIFNRPASEITLTGLTPGKNYQVRLYNRAWAIPATRAQMIRFDTDGQPGAERQANFLEDDATAPDALLDTAGRVNAVTLDYTAGSSTLTINIDRVGNGGSYHFYALTNEELIEDTPPVLVGLDPVDNATDVRVFANLAASFDIPIQVGAGNITISNVTDGTTTVIPANDPQVTIGDRQRVLIIDPASDLENFNDFAVLMDTNAVLNTFGTPFGGIAADGTWTFTTENTDVTAPQVVSLSPTNGAIEVSTSTDLMMTFDESVQRGTGNLVVKRVRNDAVLEMIDVNAGQVTVNGSEVSIDLLGILDPLTEVYVEIDAGAIEDRAGNPFAGFSGNSTWAFKTRSIRFIPITNDTDSEISTNKVYTHAIDFGNNQVPFQTAVINGVLFADGSVGAFPPTNGTSQTVGTGTSSFPGSLNGNGGADPFLTDPGMKTLVGDFVYNDVTAEIQLTGLTTGQVYDVRLYNRAWVGGGDRDQTIGFNTDGVAGAESTARFNEDDATQFDAGLDIPGRVNMISYRYTATATTLTINIDRVDTSDGSYHCYGLTNEELPVDVAPILLALDPADDAVGVPGYTNLVMTFDSVIVAGAGNITISNVTDGTADTFAAIDSQVSIDARTLTINPSAHLGSLKDYAILVDTNAIESPFGVAFAGITNATTWNFSTAIADTNAPVVSALFPLNGEAAAPTILDLVMTFDENVAIGSGNIVVKQLSDDAMVDTIDVNSAQVSINGAELTAMLAVVLDATAEYYVEVDAGAVDDVTGNAFAGIAGNATWAFTTTETGTLAYTPITGDADSGISTNNTYTHVLDFGQGTPGALVNGVQFAAYNNAANGTLNFNRTVESGNPLDHNGNGNHNVTGGLVDLLTDMYFNNGITAGGTTTWTLSGLTPGQSYDTRIYVRQWGPSEQRLATLFFDPDGTGPMLDTTGVISEDNATSVGMATANQAYYISYTFTAGPDGELVITANQQNANNSWHLYGLSNQVTGPMEPFVFTGINYTPGPTPSASFTFNSVPGKTYRIETKFDLHSATWIELVDAYTSQGFSTTFTDTVAAGMPRVYYRVRENE